jgi:hypothetical protein
VPFELEKDFKTEVYSGRVLISSFTTEQARTVFERF